MVFFRNTEVKIYTPIHDEIICGVDSVGKPQQCLILIDQVYGDLQQSNPSEMMSEPGGQIQDVYTLVLPLETYIREGCRVKLADDDRDDGHLFSVFGSPYSWNSLIPHMAVTLIKDRTDDHPQLVDVENDKECTGCLKI